MVLIETAIRGGAVAILALLGLLLLRDARDSAAGRYAGLFVLSAACYAVGSAPAVLAIHALWRVPVAIASIGTSALFYLFARARFDDEFESSWRDALVWLGTVGLGAGCAFGRQPLACPAFQGLELLFVALAIRHALIGRAGDLVEERRHFRIVLIVAAALYTAGIVVLEFALNGPPLAPLSTVNAVGLLALALAAALSQLSLSGRGPLVALAAAKETPAVSEAPRRETGGAAPANGEPDGALLDRLRRLMDEEKIFRQEGLSIAALADRMGLPEYRLRRLINQRLGHRNFNSFINGHRLAEAMAALADPHQGEVPIVTIALDAGFQSLGPFNRAFKAHTGATPTEYRRQRLGRAEARMVE